MKRPLYGLILAGGKSTRMGRDKAGLIYRDGKTQLEQVATLLHPLCDGVFVSIREDDGRTLPSGARPIYDSVDECKGPLRGILSALREFPASDWLIVACDLPNLQPSTLSKLIRAYGGQADAGPLCYRSSHDGLPEPLCAMYPSECAEALLDEAQRLGKSCPRRLLMNMQVAMIDQDDPSSLDNINTPEEYAAALDRK